MAKGSYSCQSFKWVFRGSIGRTIAVRGGVRISIPIRELRISRQRIRKTKLRAQWLRTVGCWTTVWVRIEPVLMDKLVSRLSIRC
jgi:hypothetical protein